VPVLHHDFDFSATFALKKSGDFTKKQTSKTLLNQGFACLFEVDQLIFTNEVARTLVGRATFVNRDYGNLEVR